MGDAIVSAPGMCGRQRCDVNARCVRNPNEIEPYCECNPGYDGDGRRCERIGESMTSHRHIKYLVVYVRAFLRTFGAWLNFG